MSVPKNQSIETMRQKVIAYLENKLENKNLSKTLEEAIYNDTMKYTSPSEIKILKYQIFQHRYNCRLQTLVLNIKEFEEKLLNKSITPDDIFNKKPIELFPEKWKESVRRKEEEEKLLYETQLVSNSKTAMCYKCKEKNVYVMTKQTRSADEAETIFYHCLTCHNKWKS